MNFDRYVGLPWKSGGRTAAGVDCWGLVRLFYAGERGIELPDYSEAYDDAADHLHVKELMSAGAVEWQEAEPVPGAVALIRRGRSPSHVGVVAPGRRLLHIEATSGFSCIAPITADMRRRIVGYFVPR